MKTLKCMNPLLQLQENAILYMNFTKRFKRFCPLSEGKMQYAGYDDNVCFQVFVSYSTLYVREIMFSMMNR